MNRTNHVHHDIESRDFKVPVPQTLLNIEERTRSNLFAWRGQFSPQLIEYLLKAYCPPNSVVLDPFAGSGTVLYEAAKLHLAAFGYEITPSAWIFSKVYEFANVHSGRRDEVISELKDRVESEFPVEIFSTGELSNQAIEEKVIRIGESLSERAKTLFNALIVVIDIYNNRITGDLVQSKFVALANLVRRLPYSDRQIKADLQDARALPLQDRSIDFAITSPPYINVFNYHQNYRRSVEILGWNPLRVARSEIGSNRANRGNRFYTVIQYCIDLSYALYELGRALRQSGRAVVILGYESRVLGVPFYNADIVENIAQGSNMFNVVLRQQRRYVNRFGASIREDILNLQRTTYEGSMHLPIVLGRRIAKEALNAALTIVPPRNYPLLIDALSQVNGVTGTPIFNNLSHTEYQTRNKVMFVRERGVTRD